MPDTNILCGPGLGQKSKPNQRPVEDEAAKAVRERLARVLVDNACKWLLSVDHSETQKNAIAHLTETISECRVHGGVKNTSQALKELGLQEYDT